MEQYLSSASLKSLAKGQLLGKYKTAIGAYVLQHLCTIPISMAISFLVGTDTLFNVLIFSAATFLLNLFTGFFTAGQSYIYLKIACNQTPFVNDLFHCFTGDTTKLLYIQAVLSGVAILCELPALIVGVFMGNGLAVPDINTMYTEELSMDASLFLLYTVLALSGTIVSLYVQSLLLSQVFYLMLDFPERTAPELLKMSIHLIKGSKSRLLYINFSFVPMILLGMFSFGIGLLWVVPYMQAVFANFYLDLIRKRKG